MTKTLRVLGQIFFFNIVFMERWFICKIHGCHSYLNFLAFMRQNLKLK